ncbi:MAG: efflux RND transporter permease subunit [Deltaproteobacteria bacterium]|nr:efflux RND transporter permease subunit [Deltaproteobacteria bacterium]
MIGFFAGHPTAANLLMLAFLMVGFAFAGTVKRETFPDIPADSVEVRVPFRGAAALDVEEAVCLRIEGVADAIDGREETRCEAREGLAVATLVMREGGDIDRFLNDVKTEVEGIQDFPEAAEAPVVRQLGRRDFVASIAVAGPLRPEGLKAYAERMKDDLLAIPGVAQVRVQGFSQRQIRIEVAAPTMRQFGLSVGDLADAVAAQSVALPAGAVETRDTTVLIRFDDERRTPRELEGLVVVASESGAVIRLGDIATITDRFELDEDKSFFNDKRAAYLAVEKGRDDDTLDVIDAIRAYVDTERGRAPPGMVFEITRDVASIVRDRLTMLVRNGIQGLGLVFLVMWLFFGLRYSFWVAAGLPVAFMGTIAGMAAIGYSFDMITMVALLIAVGLIMDDAIVIAENIARRRRSGRSAIEAAVEGTKEVAPGVLASFLTTIAVFGALAFLRGEIGAVMKVLPVILILTLSFSLVEAFLILPHHLKGALDAAGGQERRGLRGRFENGLERFTETWVGRLVDAAVSWRYLTVGLIVGLLLGAVAAMAGGTLKFRAFPDIEGNVLEARLLLPQGTPLARTEAVVDRVVAAIRAVNRELADPGGQDVVRNVGIQFNRNQDAHESGEHLATVIVDLVDSESREVSLDGVRERWRAQLGELPDVISLTFSEPQLGPGGKPIDIRLLGEDLDALKAASNGLLEWLRGYRGVLDLSDDLRLGKPEVRVRLREGALVLGLNASQVARQLRAAFQGRVAGEFQAGAEDYEIDIRLSGQDRNSLADLAWFAVTLPAGEQVPLYTVATLDSGRGYSRIHRIDGRRAVTIQGDLDPDVANAGEIIADTRARLLPDLLGRHPGMSVELEGQTQELAASGSSLGRNFLIGLAAIFLLLSFQFRSYVEPLVVMAAIPVGLVGVVVGHLVLGLDLSMPSMVGFVSLAGVVVNNAIVLVTFIKIHRRGGEPAAAAACRAARQRFRAILLTSLTTVAGVLPLLTETSLQAQVLVPLVTSLAFGLAAATFQVLFLVPSLYAILDDFGLTENMATEVEAER